MNQNSLIIAAGASTARLFRPAQTNDAAHPVELIEVASVASSAALDSFAREVAERAAAFGDRHVCNPVVVVAGEAVASALLTELQNELPNVYIRTVHADVTSLTPWQLLERLQQHVAFMPTRYSSRAS